MFRSCTLAALLALTFCACAGSPKPGPQAEAVRAIKTVAVLALPIRDIPVREQEAILTTMARHLHSRFKVSVLTGRSFSRAVWGKLDAQALETGKEFKHSVRAATQAVKRLQVEKSLELLNRAHTFLPYCGAEVPASVLINLFMQKAFALLTRSQNAPAEAAFRQAISFDNELAIDKYSATDPQTEVFEQAKRQLLSGNPYQVEVLSYPKGAQVFVDGKKMGTTPLQELSLFPGRHFIRLELSGHASWTQHLPDAVPPGTIRAQLFPRWPHKTPKNLLSDFSDEDLDNSALRSLRKLADFYQVDALVLARISRQETGIRLESRLFLVAPESISAISQVELGKSRKRWSTSTKTMLMKYKDLARKPKPKPKPKPKTKPKTKPKQPAKN